MKLEWTTAGGTPVLRRLNTVVVLEALREAAPDALTIAQLAKATGLARPTLAQVVDDLTADGWLTPHAPDAARLPGRPAARVSLNGLASPVLGLDIGAHSVAVAVGDLTGEQLALVRRSVGAAPDAAQILIAVTAAVKAAITAADLSVDQIASVTVGSPGLIDPAHGSVRLAPGVPGWASVQLVAHLSSLFDCPVHVENDANLAAMAITERREKGGTVFAVQWGERLGAGIVIDGRLHRGSTGSAGEIGFIPTPGSAGPIDSGGKGPLERLVGADAIGRRARESAGAKPRCALARRLRDSQDLSDAAVLFAAAREGDAVAIAVVDAIAADFARALAPAVLALDPEAVVIGGGVARAGQVLTEAVSRHLGELVLSAPSVELSPLAQDAVVTGALHSALEDAWSRRMQSLRDPGGG